MHILYQLIHHRRIFAEELLKVFEEFLKTIDLF